MSFCVRQWLHILFLNLRKHQGTWVLSSLTFTWDKNTLVIKSSERLNSRLSRTYFVVHVQVRCFCTMWLFIGCKVPIPLNAYSLKWMKSMHKWQNDRDMFCRCIYIVDVYDQTQKKIKKGPFIIQIPGWRVHICGLLIIPTKQRRLSHYIIKYCLISDWLKFPG